MKNTLEEAVELIKQHTRNFAKRQLTWFKKDQATKWFEPNKTSDIINYLDARNKLILSFKRYRTLEKNSLNLILSESFLQLINGSLMLILFLYMGELGYSNSEKAFYFVFRFTSVLFFSFPFGLWIKGKKLLPFFKISAFTLPIITLLMVYAIHENIDWLIILTFFLWGLSFSFSQICKLPFVLRHCPKDQVTEGITLSYSTWSFGNVLGGTLIFTLSNLFPALFTSQNCIVFHCNI